MAMKQFGEYAERWFAQANLSERTIYQRRIVYQRDIEPFLRGRAITCIDADEVRSLCERVKSRGAPATAVHVRDIIRAVFAFARGQGYQGGNPAAEVAANSIAVFQPRERSLSPNEVGTLCRLMGETRVRTEYQFALKLILLTLARRSELVMATWPEIDFEGGIWTIPPGRAKSTKSRCVYLSRQALDILTELKVRAGASEYVLPSMLDPFMPMSPVCLNHATTAIFKEAQPRKLPLARFSVYDLRRTASTILRDAGFNAHWVEVSEIKTVPYVPLSHPFIERLIGTVRRELLDHVPFWGRRDLERKLRHFSDYYNHGRVHASLKGIPPSCPTDRAVIALEDYRWQSHCRGLYQLPTAA